VPLLASSIERGQPSDRSTTNGSSLQACIRADYGVIMQAELAKKATSRLLLKGLSDIKQRSFLGARFLRVLRSR